MSNAERLVPIRSAERSRDFRQFVTRIKDRYGEKTAFILKKKKKKEVEYTRVSYLELYNHINSLACSLVSRGFHTQRLALIGENKYEWILSYLSVLTCGAVIVPLDKGLAYPEIKSSIERSKSGIVIFDKKYRNLVMQMAEEGVIDPENCICLDERLEDMLSIEQLVEEGSEIRENNPELLSNIEIDPDLMSVILFTSGTTSMAKAVMLSQTNILWTVYDMELAEDIRSTDISMAFLPYHHTFGGSGQLVMLSCGAETAFCDGLKHVQKNLVEYKVSVFFSVPLLIESLYKRIMTTARKNGQLEEIQSKKKFSFQHSFDIDSRRELFKEVLEQLGGNLRFIFSGGAAIEPEILEDFKAFGIETANGYGMTESAPFLAAENRDSQRSGSIGRSMPSVTIRIDNPDDEGIGEVVAQGPNVMLGYYENEEATAETLESGWLHTGDLGYVDKDGYIFICGRKKNVIVLRNGKNVFPEEIELLASDLPYVLESVVFALPKKSNPKDSTLYIEIVYDPEYFKANGIKEEEIQGIVDADFEKLNETMPKYKRIHHCIVTDEPTIKTGSGKIKRYEEQEKIRKMLEK